MILLVGLIFVFVCFLIYTQCAMELPWSFSEFPLSVCASAELVEMGAGDGYAIYRQYLQLLQFQSSRRSREPLTWLLSSGTHLPYMLDLHQVFPGDRPTDLLAD